MTEPAGDEESHMETPHLDSRQTLYDLARRLRDLVTRVRRHERLWRGPKRDWYVVTSSLDIVQDTAWALKTYADEVDDLHEDKPHAYIRIFGVLNGLVIQQDAAFRLFMGVGAPKAAVKFATSGAWASSVSSLARARQIRIAGAGHPVEWGEKKGRSCFNVHRPAQREQPEMSTHAAAPRWEDRVSTR